MKIITIVGARPQFIKAAAVSRAISQYNKTNLNKIEEKLIHTGQHFDQNMSSVFFEELELQIPDYNLGIARLSHGAMTGRMLEGIEAILKQELPDMVLIYGDTNSTLAGALAACKMHIPVAHVEAGLRSFNMTMPEEINRILSDKVSTALFCPTENAVLNLKKEGITGGVYNVGDVMYDATLYYKEKVQQLVSLNKWDVAEKNYILCTVHRAENTDDISKLKNIFAALQEIKKSYDVILPIHPRTKSILKELNKEHWLEGLIIMKPLSYFEMNRLEMSAKVILTDSGGVQKEAFFHQVPCITLRDETEWIETVEQGWNQVVGSEKSLIVDAFNRVKKDKKQPIDHYYGDGHAANLIVDLLTKLV